MKQKCIITTEDRCIRICTKWAIKFWVKNCSAETWKKRGYVREWEGTTERKPHVKRLTVKEALEHFPSSKMKPDKVKVSYCSSFHSFTYLLYVQSQGSEPPTLLPQIVTIYLLSRSWWANHPLSSCPAT